MRWCRGLFLYLVRYRDLGGGEQPARAMAPISCPTMGVWSRGSVCARDAGDRSWDFVTGPWRYQRMGCDHWVPVHAAEVRSAAAGLLG